jgi:hypothetical protein
VHDPRGFHFKADDYPTIAYAQDFGRVLRDFVGPQYDLRFFVFHRPLITLSLWGDFSLFGTNPLGYFGMNLLAFWLSLVLLQRIVAMVWKGTRGELAGLLLALLWLFHPVPIASLEWVVGRVDTHVVPWILGAVYFHLRAQSGGPRWPVWLCATLGFLSKESAFGIPLLLLGLDFLNRGTSQEAKEERGKGPLHRSLRRYPSLSLFILFPLDLLFRWFFLGQLLGGYGFLKTGRLDVPAILGGFANTVSLSLFPRDFPSPLLQWGIPTLVLLGLLVFCVRGRGRFFPRFFGICFLTMGLIGPLALLLPSMRDPANQRYAYLACVGPWLAVLVLLQGLSFHKGREIRLVPVLLLALIWLVPAQRKEQKRMKVHDHFVSRMVALLNQQAHKERSHSLALPLVVSGRAEAAFHPQRFLWGLGFAQKKPFVLDESLQRDVVSLRTLHPRFLAVPDTLAAAGLEATIRVSQDGDGLSLVPKRRQKVREAELLGFQGRLNLAVEEQARTQGDHGPGFALGPKFGGEVAICTSLGSYLLKLPPRSRNRLTLLELLLTSPIPAGAQKKAKEEDAGIWFLWNAFDLCPDGPLQLFWREGDVVVHARLWVDREFTKAMVLALEGKE